MQEPRSTLPALFALGFRPLFLAGALFAMLAVPLWIAAFFGHFEFTPAGGSLGWHRHELVFGFGMAIVAGFLLTAIQAWTGVPTISGLPVLLLAALQSGQQQYRQAADGRHPGPGLEGGQQKAGNNRHAEAEHQFMPVPAEAAAGGCKLEMTEKGGNPQWHGQHRKQRPGQKQRTKAQGEQGGECAARFLHENLLIACYAFPGVTGTARLMAPRPTATGKT